MLPVLYHTHHSRHMEDLPFWLSLAKDTGSPVLELGCGTGRLLWPLARAGVAVFGLDRDPAWLAFVRTGLKPRVYSNLPDLGSLVPSGAPQEFAGPHVFAADMSAFHLALRFGLILLPCNTFSTLPTEARRATLDCVYRHLTPSGRFAASLPNPRVLRRLPRRGESEVEEAFIHPISGAPIQVSSAWERTGEAFLLWWHYDQLLPDGRVERLTIETRHTLASVQEYERDLVVAGLEIVQAYGDYDGSAYELDSPSWIVVAKTKTNRLSPG